MYRSLDPDKIVTTIEVLERRITERFPGAGLARVCAELLQVARENRDRVERIRRPHIGLRLGGWALAAAGLGLLVYLASIIRLKSNIEDLFGVMQGIEASVNLLIVIGIGFITLITLETRWKRREALADLHELRSIVHVIDMHQLTKDPAAAALVSQPTASSPKRHLSEADLVRYLDYCSEMLSLTSKVAALYAESARDDVVIDAVSSLDQLTSNLSNKIWQKINIIQRSLSSSRAAQSNAAAAAAPSSPQTGAPQGNAAGSNRIEPTSPAGDAPEPAAGRESSPTATADPDRRIG